MISKEQLFQLEREMIEFTEIAFNYFNGKVNTFTKPYLVIIPECERKYKLGINDLNRVSIHTWNILQCNIGMIEVLAYQQVVDIIKTQIIQTVIHELSHTEQETNLCIYNNDDDYNDFIENANEYNSYLFILNNIEQISKDLNVNIDINVIKSKVYVEYNKHKSSYDHLDLYGYYLGRIMYLSKYEEHCMTRIADIDRYNTIILSINGDSFVIRNDNWINPDIVRFDNMTDFILRYTGATRYMDYSYDRATNTFVIIINIFNITTKPATFIE